MFAETGNPFHAWRVYQWLRRAKRPLPEWLLCYFDQCAGRLDQRPATPQQVAAAFDLAPTGGGASKVLRARRNSDRLALVQDVQALRWMMPNASLDRLFAELSERRNVGESTVRDAYYWASR